MYIHITIITTYCRNAILCKYYVNTLIVSHKYSLYNILLTTNVFFLSPLLSSLERNWKSTL